jgi:hypothetical protein
VFILTWTKDQKIHHSSIMCGVVARHWLSDGIREEGAWTIDRYDEMRK